MRAKPATVADLMSRETRTLGRNDKLNVADDLMKLQRIRHLPVLDEDGLLCGIVSQRDLFRGALLRALGYGSRAEQHLLDTLMVKEAMVENPITATADLPLAEAARLMTRHQIGCLPVVDGERLVGILTESDFVRLVAG